LIGVRQSTDFDLDLFRQGTIHPLLPMPIRILRRGLDLLSSPDREVVFQQGDAAVILLATPMPDWLRLRATRKIRHFRICRETG